MNQDNIALARDNVVRISPLKLSYIIKTIRNQKVSKAVNILKFSEKRISKNVLKVLNSAIANAENNKQLDIDNLFVLFSRALEAALRALKKMRLSEGKELEDDLRKRLSYLEKYRSELLLNAPKLAKTYSTRLLARLEKSEMNGWEKDERVLREVALFADRSDITEELTRLQSHHKQMLKHFRSKEPAGRPLDFLCQEAFREINTVASKATDPNITKIVVQFKTELERMREQIQNVE